MPKYNILLKDDKGYPYIRLNEKDAYPTLSMVSKPQMDGAEYYGPYGSRGVTQALLETIFATLKLPNCSRQFPRDLGKGRTCLHYHMGQCEGWCQNKESQEAYRSRILQAKRLLQGDYKSVQNQLKTQMQNAAADLNFELAAKPQNAVSHHDTLE